MCPPLISQRCEPARPTHPYTHEASVATDAHRSLAAPWSAGRMKKGPRTSDVNNVQLEAKLVHRIAAMLGIGSHDADGCHAIELGDPRFSEAADVVYAERDLLRSGGTPRQRRSKKCLLAEFLLRTGLAVRTTQVSVAPKRSGGRPKNLTFYALASTVPLVSAASVAPATSTAPAAPRACARHKDAASHVIHE